jgi:hypothetical protein
MGSRLSKSRNLSEWLGVDEATRSPQLSWWYTRASRWPQARPDTVRAIDDEVAGVGPRGGGAR